MGDAVSKCRAAGMQKGEDEVREAEGQGLAKGNEWSDLVNRSRAREQESDEYGYQRSEVARQRPVYADVHEGAAVGNTPADLDDGPCSAAECRGRQYPGQSRPDAVNAAGEVMAELVG